MAATSAVPVPSGRTGPARASPVVLPLTERQWQAVVVCTARFYGWQIHHHLVSKGSSAGWPDLVICGHGRALFVELKTDTGRLRPEQRTWLGLLAAAGCEVAVWRPTDLDTVMGALGPRQTRLTHWEAT